MTSILEKILINKRLEVERLKIECPLGSLLPDAERPSGQTFREALSNPETINIVAELKKASPSRGLLLEEFDPLSLASEYARGGAAALSVLTEERYFQGRAEYLKIAGDASGLPVLCKDFIFDPYQLHYARHKGASAVLLIVRMLSAEQLSSLLSEAGRIGLDCLVEVHNKEELTSALETGAKIIGVNNRDLDDFSIKLETSEELAPLIPPDVIKVAESGIFTVEDIRRLKSAGYNCFLIGEALVKTKDRAALIAELRSA